MICFGYKLQFQKSFRVIKKPECPYTTRLSPDLKRQLNYFKAELHNSSQIARHDEIIQKRIWNRQGGLAVGFGILFLIVLIVPILMYIYKRLKERKLRSNFTSLYKRSFHFLPVSSDLFQNANTDETPCKIIDSISIQLISKFY